LSFLDRLFTSTISSADADPFGRVIGLVLLSDYESQIEG
jgi:hypothetical protein